MDLSWDAVLLGLIVVVPGFAYFGVASVFAPPQKEKAGDFETLVRSLAVSGLLLTAEVLIVIAIAGIWSDLRHEIDDIADSGLNAYFKKHTTEAIAAITLVSLVNTGLLAALAWNGAIPRFLGKEAEKRGLTLFQIEHDMIKTVLAETSEGLGVCAYLLDSGGMYYGSIARWSMTIDPETTPDIALWDPRYREKAADAWEERGRAVIIPGSQIQRLELYRKAK